MGLDRAVRRHPCPGPRRRWVRRGAGRAILVSLALFAFDLPPRVAAGTPPVEPRRTVVLAVPVISNSPSQGSTLGALPFRVQSEASGRITSVLAPSITFNDLSGVSGAARWFHYPKPESMVRGVVKWSQDTERRFAVFFEDARFLGPDWHVLGEVSYDRAGGQRFFGIGPETADEAESNYTDRRFTLAFGVGYRLWPDTYAWYRPRFIDSELAAGLDPRTPFIRARFPEVTGVDRAHTLAQRFALRYDTRPQRTQSARGWLIEPYLELAFEDAGSSSTFQRYGLDARRYQPLGGPGWVTVGRVLAEQMDGHGIPFQELASLGGEQRLSAFPRDRFLDRSLLLLSAEQRITFLETRINNTELRWEIAPRIEWGGVARSWGRLEGPAMRFVYGVGFRLNASAITAKVDVGFSDDASAVFAGLGYPF